MYPAVIDEYLRPTTVADILAALGRHAPGEALLLAGGQSAMQAIKSRLLRPRCVIDLQSVADLRGIRSDAEGLAIGAMTRYVDIAGAALPPAFAALADAAAHVGDRQVRNRGTLGGSVCWNYLAACSPAAVLTLGGTLELVATDGSRRSVAAEDFFLGPLETARRDDELLLAVRFAPPAAHCGSAYAKWGLVTDALPVVGVCVQVSLDGDGCCMAARVGLAGLAEGACRVPAGDAALLGLRAGDGAGIADAFARVAAAVEPQTDLAGSADYRRQLIVTVGSTVAERAFARASQGGQA